MRLDLSSLNLFVSGPHAPAVAGSLHACNDQGAPTSLPDFSLAMGMPVPQDIRDAFAAFGEDAIADGGTWLQSDPTRTDQRWFVQWRNDEALVYGEIEAGDLDALGFTFGNARLRVMLRSRAAGADAMRLWVEGEAGYLSDVGPLKLNGAEGTFELEIDAEGIPDLQRLLENPSTVLDSAFRGRLTVTVAAAQIEILDQVQLVDPNISLTAQIYSPAAERSVRLDNATLRFGGTLSFANAEIQMGGSGSAAEAYMEARVGSWPMQASTELELVGNGTLTLPSNLSVDATGLDAQFRLLCLADETHFEIEASGVRLDPLVNVLGLSGGSLRIVFNYSGTTNNWSFAIEGSATQSWSSIARKLRDAHLIDLGEVDFPDVRAAVSVSSASLPSSSSGQVSLRLALGLEFIQDGNPWDGSLGVLPLRLSNFKLRLAVSIEAAGLAILDVGAEGTLSTTGELNKVLPWRDLSLNAHLVRRPDELPSVTFVVTGMPAFNLPALQGDGHISIFTITTAELELGNVVRFAGTVEINVAPEQLVSQLGLPAPCNEFLREVSELLVTIEQAKWNLAFDAVERSGYIEIIFESPDAGDIDVFGIVRSVFPSQDPGTGLQLDNFKLIGLAPRSVNFLVSFGGTREASLELSAHVHCTVLGEGFDTICTLRISESGPEFELAAGVEDPIKLNFPGLQAFADLSSTLLDQLEGIYTDEDVDRGKLGDDIDKLLDFFLQPGIDMSAQFELRQLRLIVRPTNADAPVLISGVVRPVRLPTFVDKVLPAVPSVTLGASDESIFLELHLDDDPTRPQKPLFTVPLGGEQPAEFILNWFRIGYSWKTNSIDAGLNVVIDPNFKPFDGATGVDLPAIASAFTIRTFPGAPPVPEWNVTFGDLGDPNNRGIQFIVGLTNQRFLTLNLRKTAFSITRTIFGPGGDFDGGFLFGNPPDDANDVSEFYFRGSCLDGAFITFPFFLVPLLNPFGMIFPPPIPIGPGNYGDIFFKELSLELNIPNLIYARITLERTLPQISLLTIVELIFLASKGFTVPIPETSAVRKVFFVALRGDLKLPLPSELFGTDSGGRPNMVPVVDLDVEFNAADVLGAIGQGLNAAGQIIEATGEGLALLQDSPAMLLRLVPRENRSFEINNALDVVGLKASFSASVFLLTPDELRQELILFHESHRSFGKGAARVRLGPTPKATSPVVNQQPTQMLSQSVTWTEIANVHESFNTGSKNLRDYVARKRRTAGSDARGPWRDAVIKKLWPDLHVALNNLFFEGGADRLPIWSTLPRTPQGRRARFERLGLTYALASVENLVSQLGATPSGEIPTPGADQINELLTSLTHAAPLSAPKPLDLGQAQAPLAASLTSQVLIEPPPGLPGLQIIGDAAREQLFRNRFPKPEHGAMVRALIRTADSAAERLRTAPLTNELEEQSFRNRLSADILKVFKETAIDHQSIDQTQLEDLFWTKKIDNRIMGKFKDSRQMRDRSRQAPVFDLKRTRGIAEQVGVAASQPPPAEDLIREVIGYQVTLRPNVSTANVAFAVKVPGPHVSFRVEFRQGHFVLVTADSKGVELSAKRLPSQIVGSRTPSPGVAAELTRLFVLAPKIKIRPLTRKEKEARDSDPQERSTSLYQHSLFARPEYEIDLPGAVGTRGKFTLADLLRASDRTYVVPGGPVLIAGGAFKLGIAGADGLELNVAGLLGMPGGGGDAGIFLYAHQNIKLPLPFDYELELEGDFYIVAGDMWPASLADSTLTRNSVNFNGVGTLRRHDDVVVNGTVHGSLNCTSPSNLLPDCELKMTINVGDSWELKFLDWSFTKASFNAEADLEIKLTNGSLSISIAGNARLEVQLAEFGTTTIELPSFTTCVPLDPEGWFDDVPDYLCTTIGGGTIDVPDPTVITWRDVADREASLSASLRRSGAIRVTVEVEGDSDFHYEFEL